MHQRFVANKVEGLVDMLDTTAVPYQIVLTKADKINEPSLDQVRFATEKALSGHPAAFPTVLATSSEKGTGIEELRATIAALLND